MHQNELKSRLFEVKQFLLDLQNRISAMLEHEDGKGFFKEDSWQHGQGGGGLTRVMVDGAKIEKAGVNFSHVSGSALPQAAVSKREAFVNQSFQAMGASSVIHPLNPYVPTAHMNVRLVVVKKDENTSHWWFGGGFDLTPYYGDEEDCKLWHRHAKAACDPFGKDVYPRFKKWCDDYFYLKHRNEPRGVGGLFFDDLNEWGFAQSFSFIQAVGQHFIEAYQAIIAKHKNNPYGEKQKQFQQYRRGRYVEFNLLYDRGTLFGLQSNGRTESILMSMPPIVNWQYDWHPEIGSEEEVLYKKFLVVKSWI